MKTKQKQQAKRRVVKSSVATYSKLKKNCESSISKVYKFAVN